MHYKVCILTAGIGKRVGTWGEAFNKALLPINYKPCIAQIVEKFPIDVEIVVVVGYKKEQVITYLTTVFPKRKFTFVEVTKFTGEGSGPGYSLLQAKEHLQCPFIYYSVDTIVTNAVPPPTRNWFGVGEVEDTLRFMSCKVDDGMRVVRIDDKSVNDNRLAFNGLAGVHDYLAFLHGLENSQRLIGGELQVTRGYIALMQSPAGLHAQEFEWLDTGTLEEYNNTIAFFKKYPHKL